MPEDIRDRSSIDQRDVLGLNFVKSASPYVFRKHFRQGLRSHIMEILDPLAVTTEQTGTLVDGVRWFPKARPRRMFRIFRSRLRTLDKALNEIGRVKIIERYLAPGFMATSVECIVDYRGPEGWDLMLCGFQEYVQGETIDPWTILDNTNLLPTLFDQLRHNEMAVVLSRNQWVDTVRQKSQQFVHRIKLMIREAGHIPDLAGAGNLILTPAGDIRLVDINNISRVNFDASINLDEKGYPVCDKSIEALSLIEEKVLGRHVAMQDNLYRRFLNPERWQVVKEKEALFWKKQSAN